MEADEYIWVFAYGSNMLTRKIQGRVPSATTVGLAHASKHELRWHKVSVDGSGKCDIFLSDDPASVVYGVLYKIRKDEKHLLDCAEGLGDGYNERTILVETALGSQLVHAYYATQMDSSLEPYCWYQAQVIAGAREHGLPNAYVKSLEQVACKPDPDKVRESAALALLGGG